MASTQFKNAIKVWPTVSKLFSVPHTEKEYNRLCLLLEDLLNEVGDDENHKYASLLEIIGLLIAEYEEKHFPINKKTGIEVLKYLMEEHELNQSDLKEVGSQGVVSEVLNGKRERTRITDIPWKTGIDIIQ